MDYCRYLTILEASLKAGKKMPCFAADSDAMVTVVVLAHLARLNLSLLPQTERWDWILASCGSLSLNTVSLLSRSRLKI